MMMQPTRPDPREVARWWVMVSDLDCEAVEPVALPYALRADAEEYRAGQHGVTRWCEILDAEMVQDRELIMGCVWAA